MKRANLDFEIRRNVLNCLDKCPDESVLYVCFRNQTLPKRAQMEALALGQEQGKTRFIWVVKCAATRQQVDEHHEWVMDEFEKRVTLRDHGLVEKMSWLRPSLSQSTGTYHRRGSS